MADFGYPPLLIGPNDEPTVILEPINADWMTHILGLSNQMLEETYWDGDPQDVADAIDQVDALILALMGVDYAPSFGRFVNYDESHANIDSGLMQSGGPAINTLLAQPFSLARDTDLDSIRLWLRKVGSPTGNLKVNIYAGDFVGGVSLVAYSDLVSAASLATGYGWIAFHFFGFPVTLTADTPYIIALETTDSSSSSNYVEWGAADSAYMNSLVSVWELEEASGNRLDSHSTNHFVEQEATGSAAGKVGQSIHFDKTVPSHLTIANNSDLQIGSSDWTMCLWVKANTFTTAAQRIVRNGQAAPNLSFELRASSAARLEWRVTANGTTVVSVNGTTFGVLSTGTWYFVALWHKAGVQTGMRINTVDQVMTHTGNIHVGTSDLELGRADASTGWDGLIDQAMMWKGRVLSSAELTWLYNSGAGRSYAAMNPLPLSDLLYAYQSGAWVPLYRKGIFQLFGIG